MQKKYWFRPARFWNCFAFYYPASKEGWVATLILLMVLVIMTCFILARAGSTLDVILGVVPWFIALGAVFDLLCFRFGEYPSWWKENSKRKKSGRDKG